MANIWGKYNGKPALFAMHIPQDEVAEFQKRAVLAGWTELVVDYTPKEYQDVQEDRHSREIGTHER